MSYKKNAILALLSSTTVLSGSVQALDGSLLGMDYNISGFIRAEMAVKTVDDENPYNQRGNLFNGVAVERRGALPQTNLPLLPQPTVNDTAVRNGVPADNDFNFTQVRLENTIQLRFNSNWSSTIKLRGIFDAAAYEEFDPDDVNSEAVGYLYGEPNYFEYDDFKKGGVQNRLEWAGEDYMIDIPTAYIDYQDGPLLIRAGNQQIAWGQALFFRVMDVANGLDLRRHLILDFASEEYADERISSPAIRASYQIGVWELDTFVQMFQPTIYPNPNTPYNVIASQFTVRDTYDSVDEELNSGFRLKGSIGDIGLQFMYTNRINPDGVFRWTKSNVNRDAEAVPGSGSTLAETPLEVDTTGVWSADEWFTYAAMARLDGIEGLNTLIREFPESQTLLAEEVDSMEEARRELDFFFQASGSGFRGHIAREYFREDIFGTGFSYVFQGEPGSWTDQLILNFEVTYTPDRVFTNTNLSREYIVEDEIISALVLEKYQRFSRSFPATYFVFQWMHRTESDLFGRHLSGMGGDINNTPDGVDGWDGLVLALQQPFPGLVWRADFSMLYDTRGGLLVQPALKWKPSGDWNIEMFYTYLDGSLGDNPNENIIETIEWAEEFGMRVAYQF
ncbi:DUF1302 family protein [Litorivivens sp.]|uniref:DUF1302 family protein n=1 Tax=Litorivivens sp. TaxID=2020868 RepID=UPI0035638101